MKTTSAAECCIVGAGPAGAVLALLLVRQGVPVTLLESHQDLDREFRGDTIHPSIMELMDEIGLAQALLKVPHTEVSQFRIVIGTGSNQKVMQVADLGTLKTKFPFMTIMHQKDFLEFIVKEAKRFPHFRMIFGANVQQLIEEKGVVKGVRYLGEANQWQEVRASLVVGADGRFSRVRHLMGTEVIKTSPAMDILWFKLPKYPTDTVSGVLGVGGRIANGKVFVLLDRGDYWQMGYVFPKGTYLKVREAGIETFRNNLDATIPELADRTHLLKDWDQISLLSVESSRVKRWYKPGLLLIGDAAHPMSPVGGVGINYAVQDAVVAANVLTEPLLGGEVPLKKLREVQCRREWLTRFIQAFQRLAQKQVISEALSDDQFQLPSFIRWPIVRKLPPRLIAFGFWKVHIKYRYRKEKGL